MTVAAAEGGVAADRRSGGAAGDGLTLFDDELEQRRFSRWTDAADGQRLVISSLQITGMRCAACSDIVEAACLSVAGVQSARVSAAAERATVAWFPAHGRLSDVVRSLRAAGYDAMADVAASSRTRRVAESRTLLWRLFVAAFCMMQVMMLAAPGYLAGPGQIDAGLLQLMNWGAWVFSVPVVAFAAGPFLRAAWTSLSRRQLGMDVPVSLAVLVTFGAGTVATFDPTGPLGADVYFDSLSMFVAFLLAGRWFEMRLRHRAETVLEAAIVTLPETAERVAADGRVETVSAQRLLPGDRVRVVSGQAFPADGVLVQGHTVADEALLSGESALVPKPGGAAVIAGSVNRGAPVEMRVDRSGPDTRLEAILALMREAATERPPAVAMADRWAGAFLATVLLLALAGAAVWSQIEPSRAVWVAVAVLVVTCPCALSLAAPAALLASASALARRGVIVRRLAMLDNLAGVDTLFLDKTGTLTFAQPQVLAIDVVAAGVDIAEAAHAASLATWSRHPMARAVAERTAGAATGHWTDVREEIGSGLEATDAAGLVWRLGTRAWVTDRPPADGDGTFDHAAAVWFGTQGTPHLRFRIGETLRGDAREALDGLRADGLRLVLLSGDASVRVAAFAASLALDECHAGLAPQDKLELVRRAQSRGRRVAMVGDGVNDTPALAAADVSFAMGQGALVARHQADAVLNSERLTELWFARHLSLRCRRVIRQNLTWAAIYNLACVPLALAGVLPPWAAGLGMAASSLLVVANARRLATEH
jgi:Cu2+-exporting ATPase